jgi:hypothetical protein
MFPILLSKKKTFNSLIKQLVNFKISLTFDLGVFLEIV